jgi:hypothetical protein
MVVYYYVTIAATLDFRTFCFLLAPRSLQLGMRATVT